MGDSPLQGVRGGGPPVIGKQSSIGEAFKFPWVFYQYRTEMNRSNQEEFALDLPSESTTKPTRTRQQDPLAVAVARFAANNPEVVVAAGVALAVLGLVLENLQS